MARKLLDQKTLDRFKEVGSQEYQTDPLVITKLFYSRSSATWYLTEYDPANNMAFGYIKDLVPGEAEWGYISIDEIESFKDKHGYQMERDIFHIEEPISQCAPKFRQKIELEKARKHSVEKSKEDLEK